MININVVKKWAALTFAGLLPVLFFAIVLVFYGFLFGVLFMVPGLLLGILLGNLLLRHPLRDVVEGKGILAADLSSTGNFNLFTVNVQPPYIVGKHNGKEVKGIFERNAVWQLSPIVKSNHTAWEDEQGNLNFFLNKETFNAARFALEHRPMLIYNGQIQSFITKDWLSDKEKGGFTEYGILFQNRQIEELTKEIKNFGRYVVEQLKPLAQLFQSKWVWIIVVVGIIIIMLLFAKPIINVIANTFSTGSSAVTGVVNGGNAITPIK